MFSFNLLLRCNHHCHVGILPCVESQTDKLSSQFSSVAQSRPTLCDPMDCSTPGFPVQHELLELTQTRVHWVSDAIQPSHPLSFPSPPASIIPSIRVFSNESVLHIRRPKYWNFSFSISPSSEYSGLISFRMDWLDLNSTFSSTASIWILLGLMLYYQPMKWVSWVTLGMWLMWFILWLFLFCVSFMSNMYIFLCPHSINDIPYMFGWSYYFMTDELWGEWKNWLKAQHSEN